MTRKSLFHFALVGVLWGIPYLLMKVAVEDFPPAAVVAGRTLIGASILIPIAIYRKKFGGDHSVWQFKRIFGIIVGFIGLILVVGIESLSGNSDPLSIGMVILASMGYAYAVIMVTSNLPLVDGIAINGLAMAITTVFWAPVAIAQWPSSISMNSALSLIALGVFSTAIAFILFFKVMAEIGPARSSLVTYLNTAIAVVLGVIILREPLTVGIIVGLPLVLVGSYLASRKTA